MGPWTFSGDGLLSAVSVDIDRIEQMFEHGSMSPLALLTSVAPRQQQIESLRQKIQQLESPDMSTGVYPVISALEPLFPAGGLRRGVIYELSPSRSLLWSTLAALTQAGHWVAVVGITHLGLYAARDFGVRLERVVLLPEPGAEWFLSTASLAEVTSVVVVSPAGPLPRQADQERFRARLRERGTTVLVSGSWPHAEGRLSVDTCRWNGLGHGFGVLSEQELTLSYRSRRHGQARSVHVRVSAEGMTALRLASVDQIGQHRPEQSPTPRLDRVAG